MHLMRFFLGFQLAASFRHVRAGGCTRVSPQQSSPAYSWFITTLAVRFSIPLAVARQHARSSIGTKLLFKPHSSTRPSQPPAASF
jgi:hypothetical protein